MNINKRLKKIQRELSEIAPRELASGDLYETVNKLWNKISDVQMFMLEESDKYTNNRDVAQTIRWLNKILENCHKDIYKVLKDVRKQRR